MMQAAGWLEQCKWQSNRRRLFAKI